MFEKTPPEKTSKSYNKPLHSAAKEMYVKRPRMKLETDPVKMFSSKRSSSRDSSNSDESPPKKRRNQMTSLENKYMTHQILPIL